VDRGVRKEFDRPSVAECLQFVFSPGVESHREPGDIEFSVARISDVNVLTMVPFASVRVDGQREVVRAIHIERSAPFDRSLVGFARR
jgi:hypothetical protein